MREWRRKIERSRSRGSARRCTRRAGEVIAATRLLISKSLRAIGRVRSVIAVDEPLRISRARSGWPERASSSAPRPARGGSALVGELGPGRRRAACSSGRSCTGRTRTPRRPVEAELGIVARAGTGSSARVRDAAHRARPRRRARASASRAGSRARPAVAETGVRRCGDPSAHPGFWHRRRMSRSTPGRLTRRQVAPLAAKCSSGGQIRGVSDHLRLARRAGLDDRVCTSSCSANCSSLQALERGQ